MWMRTGRERYRQLAQFWSKIFAVAFAMGVVSGIVLSYQFGTNWSRFTVVVGNVIGPMIAYEVLVAFFLEATFLGVMLFGWNRVPPWLHTVSAITVAVGTTLSAFWILSANSWMQTPAGYEMRDGIAYPLDWLAIVFNASFPYRLAHMVIAVAAPPLSSPMAGRVCSRGLRACRPPIALRSCRPSSRSASWWAMGS
jgi:cytochrome bd ubiquinol oxidase subunit I